MGWGGRSDARHVLVGGVSPTLSVNQPLITPLGRVITSMCSQNYGETNLLAKNKAAKKDCCHADGCIECTVPTVS